MSRNNKFRWSVGHNRHQSCEDECSFVRPLYDVTISTQEFVYRENPLTHLTLGLVGGIVTALILVLHAWLKQPASIKAPFISAILTAAVAPILLGILQRMKRAFVFEEPRRRY